ncbi:hypothetical protein ACNTMW_21675 [Planosporangium sp. 12N6]|uniref:hypothetical protein n=1 Tax=Planosporangium spinosum TaxID=3402278 RepID=UPI003CECA4E2
MAERHSFDHHERAHGVADHARWARTLAADGRYAEALALQEEVLATVRELAADRPGDERTMRMLADLLSAMGPNLTAIGRPDIAVGVLDECERAYSELDRRGARVRPQLADVHADKGMAELSRGHGATAVLELDFAVSTYLDLHSGGDGGPYLRDLARVLALNASVLAAHGDADLALASADAAIGYHHRSRTDVGEDTPDTRVDLRYLLLAATTAADLHGAYGRLAAALDADALAVRAARALAGAAGADRPDRELAGALARSGLHLRAAGRGADGDRLVAQARAVDAGAAALVAQRWERVLAGDRPVSLAAALDRATRVLGPERVPRSLAARLSRPAAGRAILAPSLRCEPQAAPGFAARLADIAAHLLPTARDEGVRLGLEAHYLFAVASREQAEPMRQAYRDYGFHWALVLLVCSQRYAGTGDLPMALDLAGWADAAAMGLVPFLAGAPGLAALVRACLNHHADLYDRNGESEAGAEVRRVVRSLDEYGP